MYKTEYEILLEGLKEEGRVKQLSESESSEILNEIYYGYGDFITNQRRNEKESEQELREIVLNA
jgi:hypothetical protein